MVARPINFLLKFTPSLFQIPVKKFQFLPAILVRNYSFSESIFSMVVFGIVVVVVGGITVAVVVTATTGRRAGKKGHLFTLWPTILQRKQGFFSFPL